MISGHVTTLVTPDVPGHGDMIAAGGVSSAALLHQGSIALGEIDLSKYSHRVLRVIPIFRVLFPPPFTGGGIFQRQETAEYEQIVINICIFCARLFFLLLFSRKCCIIAIALWVKKPK